MLFHSVVPEKGEITVKVPKDWARQEVEILIRKTRQKHTGKFNRFYGIMNLEDIDKEIIELRQSWNERE